LWRCWRLLVKLCQTGWQHWRLAAAVAAMTAAVAAAVQLTPLQGTAGVQKQQTDWLSHPVVSLLLLLLGLAQVWIRVLL
jgi:hypothetical protein